MKLKRLICSALAIGLLAGCASDKAERDEQAQLKAEAKLTKADAQKIALGRVPGGKVKEGELEKEKGKLIWSFDIATPGSRDITEVEVDAITGEVVAVDKESAASEAKEKKEESEQK